MYDTDNFIRYLVNFSQNTAKLLRLSTILSRFGWQFIWFLITFTFFGLTEIYHAALLNPSVPQMLRLMHSNSRRPDVRLVMGPVMYISIECCRRFITIPPALTLQSCHATTQRSVRPPWKTTEKVEEGSERSASITLIYRHPTAQHAV